MNNDNGDYLFVLEPIYTPGGDLFAHQLMTKRKTPGKVFAGEKQDCFALPDDDSKLSLFEAQLDFITDCDRQSQYTSFISVPIDAALAKSVLTNIKILMVLKRLPTVRLEIGGDYNFKKYGEILKSIARFCPLWLSDFGEGNSSLTTIFIGDFECITIAKSFFRKTGDSNAFRDLIAYIRPYCKAIIIDGVESDADKTLLSLLEIQGVKGTAWGTVRANHAS